MLKLEGVSVEKLIPYARNSRTHSDEQVAQIAASIKEFGFTNPVLIDKEDGIIAGHGRVMAARKLGLKDVPCLRLGHLSETQKRAYVIADNKLALNSGWDVETLSVEIQELEAEKFDLQVLGFDVQELSNLFDKPQDEEIKEQSYSEVFNVIVECVNETEQEKVFNRLDAEGYKCRVQSL